MAPYFLVTGQTLSGKTTLTRNLLTALQESGYNAALLPISDYFTTLARRVSAQPLPPDDIDLRALAVQTPFTAIATPPSAAADPSAPRLDLIVNQLTKKRIVRAVLGQKVRDLLQTAPEQNLYLLDSPVAPFFENLPPPLLGIILSSSYDTRTQRLMNRYSRKDRKLNFIEAERIIVRHDTLIPASVTLTEYFGKIAELHTKTDTCQPKEMCTAVLHTCTNILKHRPQHPEPDFRQWPMPKSLA